MEFSFSCTSWMYLYIKMCWMQLLLQYMWTGAVLHLHVVNVSMVTSRDRLGDCTCPWKFLIVKLQMRGQIMLLIIRSALFCILPGSFFTLRSHFVFIIVIYPSMNVTCPLWTTTGDLWSSNVSCVFGERKVAGSVYNKRGKLWLTCLQRQQK